MNDTFDLEFTSERNTVAEIRLDKVLDGHSKRGTEVRVLNRLNLDVADVDDPMLDGVPWIITKQSLNNYPSDTNERRRIFSEFATRIRYVLADMEQFANVTNNGGRQFKYFNAIMLYNAIRIGTPL